MNLLGDRLVLILGCGPRLDDQLADMVPILEVVQVPKIAADGATSALVDLGLRPDVIVTDLDGHVPDISACSRKGTIIVLHAHGDNLEAVKRWLPSLRNVLPVTQTKPTSIVRNYGGFTDGDKCLFLASAFGATGVILVGMDFGSTIGPRSDPARIKQHAIQSKLAKLDIGKRLSQTVLQSTDLRAYSLGPTPFMGVQEIQTDAIPRLLRGKR